MSQHDFNFDALLNDMLNGVADTTSVPQSVPVQSIFPGSQQQQQQPQQQQQQQQQYYPVASLFPVSQPQAVAASAVAASPTVSTAVFDPTSVFTPTPQIYTQNQIPPTSDPLLQFQLHQDVQQPTTSIPAPASPYLVPSNELAVPGQYRLPGSSNVSSALASPAGSNYASPRGSFSGGLRPDDTPVLVDDGSLLIPQPRHRRSSSVHSDASSLLSGAPSPQLPLSHSPYMESIDVSNLEGALSTAFSISDPAMPATPEITVETVDDVASVYSNASAYSESPAPFTPGQFYSDIEPFPEMDSGVVLGSASPLPHAGAASLLYPPLTDSPQNRRRSQSDSVLEGPVFPGGFYGGSTFGSNVSLANEAEQLTLAVPVGGTHIKNSGNDFLSPADAPRRNLRTSRSPSPRSPSPRPRVVTSREHILEMAGAPVGGSGGGTGTRRRSVRQHPAQHMCPMCEKTFTRAYNLQSHLRTHTNERPFKCGVCGKAFARQHDRKRHEDLHSGRKKYECLGVLSDGVTQWGCGHKFARADALGRHFRTEVGRQCIRPLVEEADREKKEAEEQAAAAALAASAEVPIYQGGVGAPALTLSPPTTGPEVGGGSTVEQRVVAGNGGEFPAALLQQFPVLANFGMDA
ncbi:uncharacterized protein SAPINGB_P003193 [Magnusiomyces paraingens]|uniref:C2H2-type domain-containing protein n=1 Tax=Magnusiomyces paraingens TaxID=2606893 RepID=A0A5E8BPW5_9ASCO|nr:uncharacterized protein SAPINGB_P003193 [Saprochaete ingens]VVT51728.1 unnamed protein product [Saprochaete ingens]